MHLLFLECIAQKVRNPKSKIQGHEVSIPVDRRECREKWSKKSYKSGFWLWSKFRTGQDVHVPFFRWPVIGLIRLNGFWMGAFGHRRRGLFTWKNILNSIHFAVSVCWHRNFCIIIEDFGTAFCKTKNLDPPTRDPFV